MLGKHRLWGSFLMNNYNIEHICILFLFPSEVRVFLFQHQGCYAHSWCAWSVCLDPALSDAGSPTKRPSVSTGCHPQHWWMSSLGHVGDVGGLTAIPLPLNQGWVYLVAAGAGKLGRACGVTWWLEGERGPQGEGACWPPPDASNGQYHFASPPTTSVRDTSSGVCVHTYLKARLALQQLS